jgi:hypothetical protein
VHTILTFDMRTTAAEIRQLAALGSPPDFIWGGEPANIEAWKQVQPAVVVTDYISFNYDPTTDGINSNRSWRE